MLVRRWQSNTAAPDPIPQEPTATPSASSKPPYANGPMQNTGPAPSKETLTCSHGSTTTTKDLMVASTTTRPSADPIQEQPLELLQAPIVVRISRRGWDTFSFPWSPKARDQGHPRSWGLELCEMRPRNPSASLGMTSRL